MTYKQKKFLNFIKKFIKDNGYSPSYKEIGAAFNVTTPTVRFHILSLKKRKFITSIPGTARSKDITKHVI